MAKGDHLALSVSESQVDRAQMYIQNRETHHGENHLLMNTPNSLGDWVCVLKAEAFLYLNRKPSTEVSGKMLVPE